LTNSAAASKDLENSGSVALFVKTPFADAQAVKARLVAEEVLREDIVIEKDVEHLYFPVTQALAGLETVERDHRNRRTPKTLKEALSSVLSEDELTELIGSYDVVGSIAILEIPESLLAHEETIAAAVIETNAHISTVLKKTGIHGGEFRTQSYECIAGIDTRETLVRESGCSLLVDVERVYFSVRLSTERLRLASTITPDEKVLVLFSGAAPYVVIFAKHSVASRVVGVEKNPVGHEYAVQNLKRNKFPASRAAVYCADAANLAFLHDTEGLFDRIVMMLPSGAKEFLGSAVTVANPARCVLHVYAFGAEHEVSLLSDEIVGKLKELGWRAHVDRAVKAGHHKPFVYRWCFDVSMEKSAQ